MPVDACFDLTTSTIVGGPMDGVHVPPQLVDLYEDGDGFPRAAFDVSGDTSADLPVCETPPHELPPASRPPPGRPPTEWPEGDGDHGGGNPVGCESYEDPPVIVGPDGCDIGYNGCGDTIGVDVNVAANATVDVNIPAPIEYTPRYFIYTGALQTFTLNRIFVANGPNSNFGAGYSADYYALTSFTSKRVSWPTFYNSPQLTLTVTNLTGQQAAFQGLLIGVATHQ